jgi:hypothetical protein
MLSSIIPNLSGTRFHVAATRNTDEKGLQEPHTISTWISFIYWRLRELKANHHPYNKIVKFFRFVEWFSKTRELYCELDINGLVDGKDYSYVQDSKFKLSKINFVQLLTRVGCYLIWPKCFHLVDWFYIILNAVLGCPRLVQIIRKINHWFILRYW